MRGHNSYGVRENQQEVAVHLARRACQGSGAWPRIRKTNKASAPSVADAKLLGHVGGPERNSWAVLFEATASSQKNKCMASIV